MRIVFADTSYLIAMANQLDELHDRAFQFANTFEGEIVTTEWVLTEFGDALSKPRWRPIFLKPLARTRK
jgi:predicted nucleic acid-binding protein